MIFDSDRKKFFINERVDKDIELKRGETTFIQPSLDVLIILKISHFSKLSEDNTKKTKIGSKKI